MELPKRKPTRLKGYDYNSSGYYFITVCTYQKQNILCDIVGEGLCTLPKIRLTEIGATINEAISFINMRYTYTKVDKYVIMPNHIHLIVKIENPAGGHRDPPLQNVIGQLKSYTTNKYCNKLWQRSFHDHIIRDQTDYLKIWNYIDTNPQKWKEDCFYIG